MTYRIPCVFLITFLIVLKSIVGYAFDPETDCSGFTATVATVANIKNALSNARQKDGFYVICFQSSDAITTNETIEINGKDKPFFVNGLSISPMLIKDFLTDKSPGGHPKAASRGHFKTGHMDSLNFA